jgi:arylsulfatase A-like enzyme
VGIASLLSGLSPLVHNVTERESRLPDEVRTLTEYLAERGYRTGAVGYSPLLAPNANFDQGFESYLFFPRSPGSSFGGIVLPALSPQRFGRERATSAELREMAVDWIDEHRDEPFFFWLHYFDPHLPYHPPAELRPQGNAPPRVGVRFDGRSAIRNGDLVLDDADKAWVRALYDAEVRDVDAQIGRLLDALREFGLYERTLIVFTSDHGEEFFEHGDFEHGHSVYDEVLRVPLILKPPGATTPRRIATSVSIVSAVPTLLDLLDFGAAAGPFSAPSLGPLVAGERNESTAHVSTGMIYYENKTALIVDDSKYVRAESGTEEFFDLEADPDERTSLAGSSPERVREARELLDRKIAEAAALRRELGLPANSRLEPDREWVENLRALGYVE